MVAVGAMRLAPAELEAPPAWSPSPAVAALAAAAGAAPAAPVAEAAGANCAALSSAALYLLLQWQTDDSNVVMGPDAAAGPAASAAALDFASAAQVVAGGALRPALSCAALEVAAAEVPISAAALAEASAAAAAAPSALHAAMLAGAAAARAVVGCEDAAKDASDPSDRHVRLVTVSKALFRLAALPGAAAALWATGGADFVGDVARQLFAAPTGAPSPLADFCLLLHASMAFSSRCDGGAFGRLVVASGAPRALARHAAQRWRAAAGGGGGEAGALCCAAGLGTDPPCPSTRNLDALLLLCAKAAGPDEARVQALKWPLTGLLALDGAPGEEDVLVHEYEEAAVALAAAEAPLREAFERDEAPALRRAAARAAAQHFGCSNILCARTAGLSRAAAKALFAAKRCSRCLVARYCSAACQDVDWRAGHKDVCRALAAEREAEAVG
jgi:hypothetical protein